MALLLRFTAGLAAAEPNPAGATLPRFKEGLAAHEEPRLAAHEGLLQAQPLQRPPRMEHPRPCAACDTMVMKTHAPGCWLMDCMRPQVLPPPAMASCAAKISAPCHHHNPARRDQPRSKYLLNCSKKEIRKLAPSVTPRHMRCIFTACPVSSELGMRLCKTTAAITALGSVRYCVVESRFMRWHTAAFLSSFSYGWVPARVGVCVEHRPTDRRARRVKGEGVRAARPAHRSMPA